jgi:hypothetical protein
MKILLLFAFIIEVQGASLYGVGWTTGNTRLFSVTTGTSNTVSIVKALPTQTSPILGLSTYCNTQK